MRKIRTIELFAGVGGFRLGLDAASSRGVKYETVWSNQWEPGGGVQHASNIYIRKFGYENHSCEDIAAVVEKKFRTIPDHDLLVGGFPCQDYSVARTLSHAKGLEGEKGVLWWSIYNILKKKGKKAPDFLMLENVDRLLKSPASQRGRDFSIMLASLSDLGYAVEWRVINAAEYGFPQRRRRVYILGYKNGTPQHAELKKRDSIERWFYSDGVTAKAFPIEKNNHGLREFGLVGDLAEISKKFSSDRPEKSPFDNAGIMVDRKVITLRVGPKYDGHFKTLNEIVLDEKEVPLEFFINKKELPRWKYLKGSKNEPRKTRSGHEYNYSEGSMAFPDRLDGPARTIVTGEGGNSPSRFKHVIRTESGKLRRLTPLELERINTFPDDHTEGVPDVKRAFIMGNALVVGVIEKLGRWLVK